MAQGFSGGFFLPAQRSVHCKGGFFASATQSAGSQPPQSHPVLFTLPSAGGARSRKAALRRYDPEEGDDDEGGDISRSDALDVANNGSDDAPDLRQVAQQLGAVTAPQRSASTSRFVRGRHGKLAGNCENPSKAAPKHIPGKSKADATGRSNNDHHVNAPAATRGSQRGDKTPPKADINSKFELAMLELHQIKGEFDLKQHRQNSAPALVVTHDPQPTRAHTKPLEPVSVLSVQAPTDTARATTVNQQSDGISTDDAPTVPERNLQSPRQRLQVAEMVMRKLYKKNVQTEQALEAAKQENAGLVQRLAELEKVPSAVAQITSREHAKELPREPLGRSVCTRCSSDRPVSVLAHPPTAISVTRIDEQQLEYLRHLAAEQDKTITSLKIRIEELSTQLTSAKQAAVKSSWSSSSSAAAKGKNTPRQVMNKLQGKLQDALTESERQKANYLKMKRDFQHLLALKTKTLYENPALLQSSARDLVQLMERQLKQLEHDHTQHLTVYNSKLYEVEQQTCESYAQQKLMEEEMARVARDVQQRDELDLQIEQCMVNVFERLHHVERENVHLKTAVPTTR